MKTMDRFCRIIALCLLVSFVSCTSTPYALMPQLRGLQLLQAGGTQRASSQPAQQSRQTQTAARSASPYWTGDGGRGRSITILPPRGSGLAANQAYLPDLVANELLSNFSSFSAMTPFDRVNNQRQYDELLSGYYADDDKAGLDLGHLASTDYMLLGDITKTSTGYALQLTVNRNSDKTTVAAYSGTVSVAELDNLTGVRRASLDLLQKIGVQLTAQARTELTRAATTDHVNAQTAMAQGINAQRQGTEVAALTYFFQAAAFDASLVEAVSRTNVLSSNISTGNIGANVRNDFAWFDDWKAKLTETETFINDMLRNTSPQRSVWYSDNIQEQESARDPVRRTTELRIEAVLHTHAVFPVSVQRTVQAVYDGLQTTGRTQAWKLDGWPRQGVTNTNPFNSRWGNMIPIVFEVLNQQGQVIGRQTVEMDSRYSFTGTRLEGPGTAFTTVRFTGVRGDDITDRLTIRIASINGRTPGEAGISRIEPMSAQQMQANKNFAIYNGVIRSSSDNRNLGVVTIPAELWGERVTAIVDGAYERSGLTSVTIPSSVTSIGARAFANNRLTRVTIPNGVATIGDRAFAENHWTSNDTHYGLTRVTIANSVTSIGQEAFASHWTTTTYSDGKSYTRHHWLPTEVTIGANVRLGNNAIGNGFEAFYTKENRKAGIYHYREDGLFRFSLGLKTAWERLDSEKALGQAVETRNKRFWALMITAGVLSGVALGTIFLIGNAQK